MSSPTCSGGAPGPPETRGSIARDAPPVRAGDTDPARTSRDPAIAVVGRVPTELGWVGGPFASRTQRGRLREADGHFGPLVRRALDRDVGTDDVEQLPSGPESESHDFLLGSTTPAEQDRFMLQDIDAERRTPRLGERITGQVPQALVEGLPLAPEPRHLFPHRVRDPAVDGTRLESVQQSLARLLHL